MSRKTVLRAKLNRQMPANKQLPTHQGVTSRDTWHIFRQDHHNNISWVRVGSVRLGRALRAAKEMAKYDRTNYFVAYALSPEAGATHYRVDPMSDRHYTTHPHPELKRLRKRNAENAALTERLRRMVERRARVSKMRAAASMGDYATVMNEGVDLMMSDLAEEARNYINSHKEA